MTLIPVTWPIITFNDDHQSCDTNIYYIYILCVCNIILCNIECKKIDTRDKQYTKDK